MSLLLVKVRLSRMLNSNILREDEQVLSVCKLNVIVVSNVISRFIEVKMIISGTLW